MAFIDRDRRRLPSRRSVLAGVLVAAAAGRGRPARAADHVHLATNLSESASNAFFADELGFFRDQGIQAQIDTFASSGLYASGVIGGTYDIGAVEAGSLAASHAKGIPLVLLANGGVYNAASPQTMLLVTKDSPITKAADFNGKTIAVSTLGGSVQCAVMAWLDKNGADYRSVSLVEVPPGVVVDALLKHRIDGGFLGEPFLVRGAADTRPLAACSSAIASRFLVTAWSARKAWVGANADLARRFQAAMANASTWAMKNRPRAAEILAAHADIPLDILQKVHHVNWEPVPAPELVQPVVDALAKYGMLQNAFAASELMG